MFGGGGEFGVLYTFPLFCPSAAFLKRGKLPSPFLQSCELNVFKSELVASFQAKTVNRLLVPAGFLRGNEDLGGLGLKKLFHFHNFNG